MRGPAGSVAPDCGETAAAAAISRYRASHGLGPVTVDPSLIRAASFQAKVLDPALRFSAA
jgi:uncharacterized protein YkwD